MNTLQFKTQTLDGIDIFYREAGDKSKPTLVLLHGFPSSSHMFRNYGSNLVLYDEWQEYFRKYQPPTPVISGKNDKLFLAAGAEVFKKDIKSAQIILLNGGHFVLEEKYTGAATAIRSFLVKNDTR